MAQERLQKIIAAAGITSRRKAEELITGGRVEVNGRMVTELGAKADPAEDHIRVDGRLLRLPERYVYVMLYKPKGCVTTVTDPEGRPTVMKLLPRGGPRVFPVGRLDFNTEGLLLLTNDGELAHKLTHASSKVPKTYLVKVSGQPPEAAIAKLRAGLWIGGSFDGRAKMRPLKTAPAQVRLARPGENPWYEVTITEGRNRQLHRMFLAVGHRVEKIKRVRYGPLALDIEAGELRPLRPAEVAQLRRAAGGYSQGKVRSGGRRGKKKAS
jgi:23S rRNA pseudouridine2605 synthase